MKLYQIDSFTRRAFHGNPAGVWIGEQFPDDSAMQAIAAEVNASETAFVVHGKGCFQIRYFTPTREVPLCGHATLASAHMLWELGIIKNGVPVVLQAHEVDLPISVSDGWVKMSFPRYAISRIEQIDYLVPVIGAPIKEAFKSKNGWVVAQLFNEEALCNAHPNFPAIQAPLIAVTTESSTIDYDYSVRVFCNPEYGITEDPVTGAAQCILAPYWNKKLGKASFHSRQLSRRGGEMMVDLLSDAVEINGQAVTVFTIDIRI